MVCHGTNILVFIQVVVIPASDEWERREAPGPGNRDRPRSGGGPCPTREGGDGGGRGLEGDCGGGGTNQASLPNLNLKLETASG